jgi:4-hydroxy-4-methyl-2-oxoglutarate aldolase
MEQSEFVARLQQIDSATVANSIEGLEVRRRNQGYTDIRIKAIRSQPTPMVGYAVTFKVDTSSTLPPDWEQTHRLLEELLQAVADSPNPVVVCVQEAGPDPRRATHVGDVLATGVAARGAVGLVSDSGVRDLDAMEGLPLWLFGAGRVVAHGRFTLTEVGCPVEIGGLEIEPGDLLHGDDDGIVLVPTEEPERLLALIEHQVTQEAAARERYRAV